MDDRQSVVVWCGAVLWWFASRRCSFSGRLGFVGLLVRMVAFAGWLPAGCFVCWSVVVVVGWWVMVPVGGFWSGAVVLRAVLLLGSGHLGGGCHWCGAGSFDGGCGVLALFGLRVGPQYVHGGRALLAYCWSWVCGRRPWQALGCQAVFLVVLGCRLRADGAWLCCWGLCR